MSDPNKIREAASYHVGEAKYSSTIRELHDAALAYADSLEDPIWWCFEHDSGIVNQFLNKPTECRQAEWLDSRAHTRFPCDIAQATRPRRIE